MRRGESSVWVFLRAGENHGLLDLRVDSGSVFKEQLYQPGFRPAKVFNDDSAAEYPARKRQHARLRSPL